MSFETLQVKPEIVKALQELGITSPTLIQEKAIPPVLAGKDLIGMSKTGSGKTAAFGIPILQTIESRKGLQVLIMAPTRELAVQIGQELQKFSKYMRCSIATVFGGVSINPQIEQIARADIVVGTPGRLKDHLQRRTLDLSHLRCVVLDEADKMVEMGFIEDIRDILDHTPEYRQVLLFGATISSEIDSLKKHYMHDPVVAEAEAQVKEDLLEQFYYNVEPQQKFSLLVHLLKKENTRRVIIFCSARSTVEILTRNLRDQGIHADMIHGKLSQNRRLQVIERFNHGRQDVLVASAVAARGLDIKEVTHVFNYDLSQDPQEYIHRIGRTARAGESGKAITLLTHRDFDAFREILNRYRVNVEELPLEDFPRLRFNMRSAESHHSRFGVRDHSHQNFRPQGRFGFRRQEQGGRSSRFTRSMTRN